MSYTPPTRTRRASTSIRPGGLTIVADRDAVGSDLAEPNSADLNRTAFHSLKSQPTSGAGTPRKVSGVTVPTSPMSSGLANLNEFKRTLPSDLDSSAAYDLLRSLDERTNLFKEFDEMEFVQLSNIFTFLRFNPGDAIIEAGEESSFVGILMNGSLSVQVSEAKKIEMKAGSLLGETSFFQGGIRTAAVTAQSEAVLAMLTFQELDSLRQFGPNLRLKLITLFATEGIKKLSFALTNHTGNNFQSDNTNNNSGTSSGMQSPTKQESQSTASLSAKAVFDVRKVETLFQLRLQNEQKRLEEIQRAAQQKQSEIEHKNINMNHIHERHLRELEKKNHTIFSLEQEIQQVKTAKKEALKKVAVQTKLTNEAKAEVEQWRARLNQEQEQRKTIEDKFLHLHIENQTLTELHKKYEGLVTNELTMKRENEAKDKLIEEEKQKTAKAMQELEKLRGEFESQLQSVKNAQLVELERLKGGQDQYTERLEALHNWGKELQAKLDLSKAKQIEMQEKLELLQRRLIEENKVNEQLERTIAVQGRELIELQKQQKKETQNKSYYRKLLKITSIQSFVKSFRRKRILLTMLQEYEKLAQTLYSNLKADYAQQSNLSLEPPPALGKLFAGAESLSKPESAGVSPASSAAGSLAAVTRIESIIEYLSDLSPYLTSLIEKTLSQRIYWRLSADSFFNRTIQLKQELIAIRAKYEPLNDASDAESAGLGDSSSAIVHRLPVPSLDSLSQLPAAASLVKYHPKPELEFLEQILDKETERLRNREKFLNQQAKAKVNRKEEENRAKSPRHAAGNSGAAGEYKEDQRAGESEALLRALKAQARQDRVTIAQLRAQLASAASESDRDRERAAWNASRSPRIRSEGGVFHFTAARSSQLPPIDGASQGGLWHPQANYQFSGSGSGFSSPSPPSHPGASPTSEQRRKRILEF